MKAQFIPLLFLGIALTAMGCDSKNKTAETTPPTPEAASAQAKATSDPGGKPFAVQADAASVSVGTDGKANLSIKPAAGFKVNEDYPWKATFADAKGVTLTQKEFAKDTWKLSPKGAELEIPLKASEAGEHTLTAKVNFSVCNDEKCEVVRDHEVNLKVAAK
ncbi:MAG: hypothetical protein AAFS10_03770 [Myxococcota bacterium]